MSLVPSLLVVFLVLTVNPLTPCDHTRSVKVGDRDRPYLVHVPPSYDPQVPTPVILALHPFATNGPTMALISGLSGTADREGFLVVYPNGTGRGGMLHWNVGTDWSGDAADVGYIAGVLDDLATVAHVDPKRVYATGFSNGAMLCYRLASELSDRIAAIAPVAGTMTTDEIQTKHPVPVLHFHGTKDSFVSFQGTLWRQPRSGRFRGVEATVRAWAEANGCPGEPVTAEVPRDADDGLVIKQMAYGPGREGSEVVLYVIEGGGHTWPGRVPPGTFLGKTALDLGANDLIWEFFCKHPMK